MRSRSKLLLERHVTASSPSNKRLLPLILAGLSLAACQGDGTAPKSESPPDLSVVEQLRIPSPPVIVHESYEPTTIALLNGTERVKVGDSWEKAREVFPEPRGAYELHDLPPGFTTDFAVRGWDTGRGEGYGVILLKGKVVAAMYQAVRVDETRLAEMVALHRQGTADLYPSTITSRTVRYWFWESPDNAQRLMISAQDKGREGLCVTLAMGDSNVLKALRITQGDAMADGRRLDNGVSPTKKDETPGIGATSEPNAPIPR